MTTLRISASRVVLFVLLTAFALTVDLTSKSVVFNDLGYPGADPNPTVAGTHDRFRFPVTREGESVQYIHVDQVISFRLLTSFNKGALWGLGQDYTWVFAALSMAAVVGIPVWLFGFSAARASGSRLPWPSFWGAPSEIFTIASVCTAAAIRRGSRCRPCVIFCSSRSAASIGPCLTSRMSFS